MKRINQLIPAALLALAGLFPVRAQSPLTLKLSNTAPDGTSFDGVVFFSGSQYGDASIYATFGGNGNRYFLINSPGQNKDIEVKQDGFFNIRPTGNYVVDNTKILKFDSSPKYITGSVSITAKQLVIGNTFLGQTPVPGAQFTTNYETGTGTYPIELAIGKFGVQLLDANGNFLRELDNPNDMGGNYTSREGFGFSKGFQRHITATLPADLGPGTYKVRVVTRGLRLNVLGSASYPFTIKAPVITQVVTRPGSFSPASACTGGKMSLYTGVIDDGLLGVRETPDGGGKYWVSYYNAKTNQLVSDFQTYNEEYVNTGPVNKRTSGDYSANNTLYGLITIPNDLPPGEYYCRVFVGDPTNRLNPNNASNSGTFTVNATATVTISDGSPNIKPGEAAAVKLTFGGAGPWSFSHDKLNGGTYSKQYETMNPAFIYIYPTTDYLFDGSKLLTFSGACGNGIKSGSSQIRVTKLLISTVSLSSADICPGRDKFTVDFKVNGSLGANYPTYTAQLSDKNGNFQTPLILGTGMSSPIPVDPQTMKSLSPGSYKVRVITNSSSIDWDGSSVPIKLTRSPLPLVTDISYCASSPQPLRAEGKNLFWFGVSKDNQPYVGYDKAETPPSPREPGFYQFQVAQTVDGCNSDLAFLKVTVKPKSAPPGDATREVCQNEPAQQLTTNAQNPVWEGGNGQAPTPATGAPGTQTFKLSQDTNGCRSDQSTITVRVKPLPAAPGVTAPTALCQFGPSQKLTASGNALKWYRADGSLIGTDAPTPNLGNTATQTYQVSQTADGCESPKATIGQTFRPSPAKPATDVKTYCVNQSAVPLTATLTAQTLIWYKDGGKLSEAPKPPTGQAQTLTYEVSQTDGTCESERNTLTVRVLAAPGKPAVRALGLCQGLATSSLSANTTAEGPLTWYADAATATSQPEPTPVTSATGSKSYFVTQTVGSCEGPRAELVVTVFPIPAAPAAPNPAPVCEQITGQAQPVGPFTASGKNLLWLFVGQPAGVSQPPTTATSPPGTFTVAVTQTVDGCASPRTTVSQTINPAPVKPMATSLLLCRLKESAPVSATALTGHKLNWYGQSETGGTASSDAPIIGTNTAIQTSYYVSQTQESTSCESLRQAVSVIVADSPGPPSVNAIQAVCLNTTPVALTAGGNALVWTASSGGGLTSPEVAPVPPTSAAATYSYTVVQRLGSCVSPISTITFTVRPLPVAPVVNPLQIACINDASFTLSATALTGYKLAWYDNEQRKNPQSSVTVSTGAAATKNWFVTQTDDNGCEGPATSQTSRILAKATARLYGDDDVYFFDSTAIRIQLGGQGPWNLTLWNDKVLTNNLTNPLVVWVPPTTVTRTYALKALSNECGTGTPSNNYEIRIINRPVVTAVDPGLPDASLTAYPNPVGVDVRVDWRATSRTAVVLKVVSITGSVIWQVERMATGALQTETIQAGFWAAGVYTLQLQTGPANVLESRLLKL